MWTQVLPNTLGGRHSCEIHCVAENIKENWPLFNFAIYSNVLFSILFKLQIGNGQRWAANEQNHPMTMCVYSLQCNCMQGQQWLNWLEGDDLLLLIDDEQNHHSVCLLSAMQFQAKLQVNSEWMKPPQHWLVEEIICSHSLTPNRCWMAFVLTLSTFSEPQESSFKENVLPGRHSWVIHRPHHMLRGFFLHPACTALSTAQTSWEIQFSHSLGPACSQHSKQQLQIQIIPVHTGRLTKTHRVWRWY